jgi:flagellar assembly factor FliW
MKINTRVFGEIEIAEDKIITFEEGIIGFPDCKKFALLYDEEKGEHRGISWMQSLDEPVFALPVMDPLLVKEDYNPMVEDELLKSLGKLDPEDTFILVTVTAPPDLKELSVNLKAPLIINARERKAVQMIIEDDLPVKYKIYDLLQARKAGE